MGTGGRMAALAVCATLVTLWAFAQMLLLRAPPPEQATSPSLLQNEKAHQAQVEMLEHRIEDLERELAEERRDAALAGRGNPQKDEAEGGLRGSLMRSLKAELAKLKDENHKLKVKVQGLERSQKSQREEGVLAPAVQAPTKIANPQPGERITEDQLKSLAANDAIGVAVISCKRPNYLKRTMDSVQRTNRDPARFPVVISQDSFDHAMTQMVESNYVHTGLAFHMHHEHEASAQGIAARFGGSPMALGYVLIAQHFGFAMRRMFDDFGFNQVIFLEEDIEVAPDFFSYFGAMIRVLRADTGLFCVSAWNDNGYSNLVSDPNLAFRTDFFPGLGWMMTKQMWGEVQDRWAVAYWDEFMRRPDVRKGRHCIRPDVSRSFTFGEEGTSSGQFFSQHLSRIKLNDVNIDWDSKDLSYLASSSAFDSYLERALREAAKVPLSDVDRPAASQVLRVEYDDARDYQAVAAKFGLMPDEKEGIRRMSYRGVIPFAWKGNRIYLHTRSWPGTLG